MGLIELDPKEILVDGVRKELVKTVGTILHETFIFKTPGSKEELYEKFENLRSKFAKLEKSFEYIQDFLNINGETLWKDEISRILRTNLDKEATFLINKKYEAEDLETGISIPVFEPVDPDPSPTFLGRILNQLISITSVDKCFYLEILLGYFDLNGNEVFGMKNVVHLEKDMGAHFLQTLDQLASYKIMHSMKSFI